MAIDIAGLLGGAAELGAATLPYTMTEGIVDKLEQMGQTLKSEAGTLGESAASEARFTPFTVTTAGGGTVNVGDGGGIDYSQALGTEEADIRSGMLGQAQTAAGAYTPTSAADLYAKIQEMRNPEITRQRQALESRLAAQGRLGTQTSMFGGTPEALAMEKAIQEQQSEDILSALTQAPQLDAANLANITGMLGVAYSPEQRAQEALTPAAQFANIAMSGGLGAAESLYKSGIAGLEAGAAGTTAAATLEGQRARALADALGGFFAADAASGQQSAYDQLLEALGL